MQCHHRSLAASHPPYRAAGSSFSQPTCGMRHMLRTTDYRHAQSTAFCTPETASSRAPSSWAPTRSPLRTVVQPHLPAKIVHITHPCQILEQTQKPQYHRSALAGVPELARTQDANRFLNKRCGGTTAKISSSTVPKLQPGLSWPVRPLGLFARQAP
jgi:hypothetical protein